jgi:hypothetical protein
VPRTHLRLVVGKGTQPDIVLVAERLAAVAAVRHKACRVEAPMVAEGPGQKSRQAALARCGLMRGFICTQLEYA